MQFRWNRHEIERSAGRPGHEICEKPVPIAGAPALNRALCQPTSLFSKPYRSVEAEREVGWHEPAAHSNPSEKGKGFQSSQLRSGSVANGSAED